MSNSTNSVSTLITQLLRLYNNNLEGFDKISEAVTSNKENVTLDLFDNNDKIRRVSVPSFGFMKSELERLDKNIQNLSGISDAASSIRMADGSFRKIIVSKLDSEAPDIKDLNSITNFKSKSNFFFENLLNPLLYVSFDITNQAPIDTEKVIVKRFLLDLDSQAKINWFNKKYNGRADINYIDFLQDILNNSVSFIPDEEILDLPPRELRYYGKFSVLRISDIQETKTINSVEIVQNKKLLKLDKLFYTDIRAGFSDTVALKVGNFLAINSDTKDTKYKITSIDSSTNSIVVELVEGFRSPQIGTEIFSFYSEKDNNLEVQVPISFNERNIVFIKAIDPDSKLPAKNWSPGSAFYTNDLEITNTDGSIEKLEKYYKFQVVDFGNHLLAMAKDKIPPSTLGIIPDAPTLDPSNFKVL